jgi:alkaline phosphatase
MSTPLHLPAPVRFALAIGLLWLAGVGLWQTAWAEPLSAVQWVGNMLPPSGLLTYAEPEQPLRVSVQAYKPAVTGAGMFHAGILCYAQYRNIANNQIATQILRFDSTYADPNADQYIGDLHLPVGIYEINTYCTDVADAYPSAPRVWQVGELPAQVVVAGSVAPQPPTSEGRARYVLLFLADGLGPEQLNVARRKLGSLTLDILPFAGLAEVKPLDADIPDAAAAVAQVALGQQVRQASFGMDTYLLTTPNLVESARQLGLASGIVSNRSLTDAVPAAFYAHSASELPAEQAAEQLLQANFDIAFGGGEQFFQPQGTSCHAGGIRTDGRSLVAEAQALGYQSLCSADDLIARQADPAARALGLFATSTLESGSQPSLASLTQQAIQGLAKNPNGFVLVVHSGQIDQAAHNNDADALVTAIQEFDAAVREGIVFANAHAGEALVVMAGLHETGGLTYSDQPTGLPGEDTLALADGTNFYAQWGSPRHTDLNVPVRAWGPFAHLLHGTYPLTQVYRSVQAALGFTPPVLAPTATPETPTPEPTPLATAEGAVIVESNVASGQIVSSGTDNVVSGMVVQPQESAIPQAIVVQDAPQPTATPVAVAAAVSPTATLAPTQTVAEQLEVVMMELFGVGGASEEGGLLTDWLGLGEPTPTPTPTP